MLFGRNGAEANILNQIISEFSDPPIRWITFFGVPWRPEGHSDMTLVLALDDAARDESLDASFLAEVIRFEDATFEFVPDVGIPPPGPAP